MIRVVVVEDEWILRKGLISSVDWSSLGCTVAGEAGNGKEGLELILRERPEIVISDIRMPVMDGLDMLAAAKKEYDFCSVILTSYAEFDYARRAVSLHASDYILKPVDESALYDLLLKLTEELRLKQARAQMQEGPASGQWPLVTEFLEMDREDVSHISSQTAAYSIRAIRERYRQRLSIEDIAEELQVSSRYVSQRFKEATGYSFLDYLNRYRINKAIQLLTTRNCRVNEAADLTGFTSYKHFYEVFRRYAGLTPTEFLRERDKIIAKSPRFL